MNTPQFTISILTYTAIGHARACVDSVLKSGGDFVLHLTANGSGEAAQFFESVAAKRPGTKVTVNAKNEGFWRPHNEAFAQCETEFFVALNDDTLVTPGWLEALRAPFLNDPKAVLTGPIGGCSELSNDFHGKYGRQEYIEGACLMGRVSILRQHGFFNDDLPGKAYGEDSELSLRYRALGYNLHWVQVLIPHARTATSRSVPECRQWSDANHGFLEKKYRHYLKVRKFGYPILIKRRAAWGDVLLVTPVIRALKRLHPMSSISVESGLMDIFTNNPHVHQVSPVIRPTPDTLVIDLNGSYENAPGKHIVQAYADACGLTRRDMPDGDKTEMFPSVGDLEWAQRTLPHDNWIGLHVGPSTWPSKQWPFDRFVALATMLQSKGYRIALLGTPPLIAIPHDIDLRGKTNTLQLAAAMTRLKVFCGIDSYPLHVSQAMGTSTVGLFGVTDPKYIMTCGSKYIGVASDPNHPGSGLRHRVINATFVPTETNPLLTVSVESVMEAVRKLLEP